MRLAAKYVICTGVVGLSLAVLGVTGCRSTHDRTTGQAISDTMTARDVKRALAKAPIFKYNDVKANVYNGNVQLTGFVETAEQRSQAAEIAASVPGVRQVVNEIMIKPTPVGRATIRDPLGRETGRVMLDTNAPPPGPLQLDNSSNNQNSSGTK